MQINEEVEEFLQNQLPITTEKVITPVMTTHSSEWYRKKSRKAVVTMKTTIAPPTAQEYSPASIPEQTSHIVDGV